MWKKIKEFLLKFFSSAQTPVNLQLTPEVSPVVEEAEEEPEAESPTEAPREEEEAFPLSVEKEDVQLTPNFKLSEFSCNDAKKTAVPKKYMKNVTELAENLQVLRDKVKKPIHINSAYRTKAYNTKVGGAEKSQHLTAKAADITIKGMSPSKVGELIKSMIKDGELKAGGVGIYKTFVHYDIRGVNRRWYGAGAKK